MTTITETELFPRYMCSVTRAENYGLGNTNFFTDFFFLSFSFGQTAPFTNWRCVGVSSCKTTRIFALISRLGQTLNIAYDTLPCSIV